MQTADPNAVRLTLLNQPDEPANTGSAPDVTPLDLSKKTVAEVLGEIVWLMSQDKQEKVHTIGDLEHLVMPALMLRQFKIFYVPPQGTSSMQAVATNPMSGAPAHPSMRPIGAVLWAMASDELTERLTKDRRHIVRLSSDEWKSGPTRVLTSIIAPFGGQDEMVKDVLRR